jgi:uncharacterized protein (UPF0297 family)
MVDNNTQFFKTQPEKTISVEGILEQVYLALKEKGYNPVNQIVGYIMSGDPTYITSLERSAWDNCTAFRNDNKKRE